MSFLGTDPTALNKFKDTVIFGTQRRKDARYQGDRSMIARTSESRDLSP